LEADVSVAQNAADAYRPKQVEHAERLRTDARKPAFQALIDAEEETFAKIQSEKNDKAESIGSTFAPKISKPSTRKSTAS
jgi:hypothetical protein